MDWNEGIGEQIQTVWGVVAAIAEEATDPLSQARITLKIIES